MQPSFELRRSPYPYFAGAAIGLVFVIIWLLERFRGIGAEFSQSIGYSVFVWLFVAPVTVWLVYLAWNREPVVSVVGSSIHVSSPSLSWRMTTLAASDILSIESDWLPGTSHARVVFKVSDEEFANHRRRGPWIKRKDSKLYLDVLNTELNPDQVAAKLRTILEVPDER